MVVDWRKPFESFSVNTEHERKHVEWKKLSDYVMAKMCQASAFAHTQTHTRTHRLLPYHPVECMLNTSLSNENVCEHKRVQQAHTHTQTPRQRQGAPRQQRLIYDLLILTDVLNWLTGWLVGFYQMKIDKMVNWSRVVTTTCISCFSVPKWPQPWKLIEPVRVGIACSPALVIWWPFVHLRV